MNKKKRKGIIIVLVIFIFGLLLWKSFDNIEKTALNVAVDDKITIPLGSVHWHPKFTIKIDDELMVIPNDIGYGTGRIVDTHLSGMRMSPTHTHESDGTIHIENKNPSSKPETLTLGYFFYVWDKEFSSTCIFDYCTDKGVLTMYVNGQENTEFQNYIMRDGDEILIEYETE